MVLLRGLDADEDVIEGRRGRLRGSGGQRNFAGDDDLVVVVVLAHVIVTVACLDQVIAQPPAAGAGLQASKKGC